MNPRLGRGPRDGDPRRRRSALLGLIALAFAALILGPLAAIAAAGGDPTGNSGSGTTTSGSGGGGLITTSNDQVTLTVGTTALTVSQTVPTAPSTTTTCTEPAVGTVTSTTTTSSSTPTGNTGAGVASTTTANSTTTASSASGDSASSCQVAAPATIAAPSSNPFAKRGMWIWELPATDGGSVSRIIAQAKRYGIGALYIKNGDGTELWTQFNSELVRRLHAAGLTVCAWQYVYGNSPGVEAQIGADAVKDGADCLVIDAEGQYARKYLQAQEYMGWLRAKIGSRFPVALAGLPYVDYHPTFPYSVFLGPNGAQYNLPQMYWQDIGTTVAAVYAHTYEFNELYQRPISPLGQIFDSPSARSVRAFRSVGLAYRATGINWWDFQSAGAPQLGAIAAAAGPIHGFVPDTTVASVGRGAAGDLVVLAQEHLWNTHERVTIDGGFGAQTQRAVAAFQAAHGLTVSGVITPQTWSRLLAIPAPHVVWARRGKAVVATVRSAAS